MRVAFLSLQQNFIAIAIPAVIAAVAVMLIDHRRSASAHHEDVGAEIAEPVAGRAAAAVSSK